MSTPAPSKKEQFLAAASEHYTVVEIAEATGIGRSSHYDWLKSDPEYAKQFREQHKAATTKHCDDVIKEIVRRGREGVVKPVYQGGKRVGRIRQYSDTLLIFHAKAVMPRLYNPQCITPEQVAEALVQYSDALLDLVPADKQAEARERLTRVAVAVASGQGLADEMKRITDGGASGTSDPQ